MEEEQELVYRNYLNLLTSYTDACNSILTLIDNVKGQLGDLGKNYISVSSRTTALQSACESLLAQQQHLELLEGEIKNRLAYFDSIEEAVRFLSLPGDVCTRDGFSAMLEKLDAAGSWLEEKVGRTRTARKVASARFDV